MNGSPKPTFHTDDNRTLFQALLYFHPRFKKVKKANNQIGTKLAPSNKVIEEILSFCLNPKSIHEIMELMNWKDRSKFRNKYIRPLLNENLVNMTEPSAPNSPKQKYFTSNNGKNLLSQNE
jgi:ATP-dependent DNA helicase RecG